MFKVFYLNFLKKSQDICREDIFSKDTLLQRRFFSTIFPTTVQFSFDSEMYTFLKCQITRYVFSFLLIHIALFCLVKKDIFSHQNTLISQILMLQNIHFVVDPCKYLSKAKESSEKVPIPL